jgi:hypothetical protein
MTYYPNHVEHNSAYQKHPSDDGLAFLYGRSTEILLDVGNRYRLSSRSPSHSPYHSPVRTLETLSPTKCKSVKDGKLKND